MENTKNGMVKYLDFIGTAIIILALSVFGFTNRIEWFYVFIPLLIPVIIRGIMLAYIYYKEYLIPVRKAYAIQKLYLKLVEQGAYKEDAFRKLYGMELATEKNSYSQLRQKILDLHNEIANDIYKVKNTGVHAGKSGQEYLEHYYNGKVDTMKEISKQLKILT